ncbi:hypothetical protein D3C81_1573670 [compost metagenome]
MRIIGLIAIKVSYTRGSVKIYLLNQGAPNRHKSMNKHPAAMENIRLVLKIVADRSGRPSDSASATSLAMASGIPPEIMVTNTRKNG